MSYNNQLPIVLQYFTNIAAIQSVGVIQQIWLYVIIGGMLLMYQNITMRIYGAWMKTYYVLCPKTYRSFGKVSQSTASSRQAARGTSICETGLLWYESMWAILEDNWYKGCDKHLYILCRWINTSWDRFNSHHEFHHDSCDYHWDFYGH